MSPAAAQPFSPPPRIARERLFGALNVSIERAEQRARERATEERLLAEFTDFLRGLEPPRPRPKPPAARLGPFVVIRPAPALTACPELAVFDVLPPARRVPAQPALPGPVTANSQMPAQTCGMPQRPVTRCPSCGWTDVRRSMPHSSTDYLLSVVGLVPYRCRTCSERFHRTRSEVADLDAASL